MFGSIVQHVRWCVLDKGAECHLLSHEFRYTSYSGDTWTNADLVKSELSICRQASKRLFVDARNFRVDNTQTIL